MVGDAGNKRTTKQQRAAQRAAKVAAYQQALAKQRRNRTIGIASGIIGGAAVLTLIVTFVTTGNVQRERPADIAITGLQEFPNLPATHVGPEPVDYEDEYGMLPPAGGNHFQAWLNCGIYDQPQPDENAVHSLEHGAVWVTYEPDAVSDEDVALLRDVLPSTHTILSPYPGLPSSIVASAWGAQVALESASDERLGLFIDKYWKSASAPEPGASCAGAVEGPGRVG